MRKPPWQQRGWYKWRGNLRSNVEKFYHYVNKFSLQTKLSKAFVLDVYICDKNIYIYIYLYKFEKCLAKSFFLLEDFSEILI